MESINGWLKEELFNDFKLKEAESIPSLIDEYIRFFNEERPSYSLNYLTPKQFKEIFTPSKCFCVFFSLNSPLSNMIFNLFYHMLYFSEKSILPKSTTY